MNNYYKYDHNTDPAFLPDAEVRRRADANDRAIQDALAMPAGEALRDIANELPTEVWDEIARLFAAGDTVAGGARLMRATAKRMEQWRDDQAQRRHESYLEDL